MAIQGLKQWESDEAARRSASYDAEKTRRDAKREKEIAAYLARHAELGWYLDNPESQENEGDSDC